MNAAVKLHWIVSRNSSRGRRPGGRPTRYSTFFDPGDRMDLPRSLAGINVLIVRLPVQLQYTLVRMTAPWAPRLSVTLLTQKPPCLLVSLRKISRFRKKMARAVASAYPAV